MESNTDTNDTMTTDGLTLDVVKVVNADNERAEQAACDVLSFIEATADALLCDACRGRKNAGDHPRRRAGDEPNDACLRCTYRQNALYGQLLHCMDFDNVLFAFNDPSPAFEAIFETHFQSNGDVMRIPIEDGGLSDADVTTLFAECPEA